MRRLPLYDRKAPALVKNGREEVSEAQRAGAGTGGRGQPQTLVERGLEIVRARGRQRNNRDRQNGRLRRVRSSGGHAGPLLPGSKPLPAILSATGQARDRRTTVGRRRTAGNTARGALGEEGQTGRRRKKPRSQSPMSHRTPNNTRVLGIS